MFAFVFGDFKKEVATGADDIRINWGNLKVIIIGIPKSDIKSYWIGINQVVFVCLIIIEITFLPMFSAVFTNPDTVTFVGRNIASKINY